MSRGIHIAVWAAAVLMALPIAHATAGEPKPNPQSSVVTDGPVKLKLTVDKSTAHVVDPIRLTLEVEAPNTVQVTLPKVGKSLGQFDVRSSKVMKDIPADVATDTRRSVLTATLDTIKTGDVTIPPLDIQYSTGEKDAAAKTMSTKPLQVRIASVLENRADPTKFRDIKQTVDVDVPQLPSRAWIGWTAAGVGSLALASLLLVALKKRRRGPSPVQWALDSITDLENIPVNSPADAEAVVNEVVDIVREFFELEFDMPTLTRTSRELLSQAAKETTLNESARQSLTWLSSLADQIKFARLGVDDKQVRLAIEQAKQLVVSCHEQRLARTKGAA